MNSHKYKCNTNLNKIFFIKLAINKVWNFCSKRPNFDIDKPVKLNSKHVHI